MHGSVIARKNGSTSVVLRVFLENSSVTTGAGLTALDHTSAGLIISTIADNEATATNYKQSDSTLETITTLGTFTAPTATKARFKEIDATNQPGAYELQIADARFAVSSAKQLDIHMHGATNLKPCRITVNHRSDVRLVEGDSTAAITLKQWVVSNSAGDAVQFVSTGSNGSGLVTTGNGTGSGQLNTGGATGHGSLNVGGATSGNGQRSVGSAGNSHGVYAAGQGSASGYYGVGGATGHGQELVGGATSGVGQKATGTAGNSQGVLYVGQGSAAGFRAVGGATGNGFEAIGGATSGDGGLFIATTSGDGLQCTAAGASTYDIRAASSLLDSLVETGYFTSDILALLAAKLLGKRSGMATATNTYRDVNDTANRIVETTDADGNCTATVLTAP